MSVNSKVNGFLLLLSFGLISGLLFGGIFGSFVAMTVVLPGIKANGLWIMLIKGPILPLYGAWVGALMGILPGICYGLFSYYFTKKWHWLFGGILFGALPGFFLVGMFSWENAFTYCAAYGIAISLFNITFPRWWGMRLRAEGIELLRSTN